jgi:hypothetical protein
MKPGPKPRGDHALTGAERMRAYRERKAAGEPSVRYRKPKDRHPGSGDGVTRCRS